MFDFLNIFNFFNLIICFPIIFTQLRLDAEMYMQLFTICKYQISFLLEFNENVGSLATVINCHNY